MEPPVLPRARLEPPAVRAIVRERVDRWFDRAREVPLTVVVGPAGAGKTTAASHLVQRSPASTVWYRAHPVDGREATLCEHLAQALRLPGHHGRSATKALTDTIGGGSAPTEIAALLVAIEEEVSARTPPELVLVIDEFDALIGTDSETAIGEAIPDLAPSMHLVTLSRQRPRFKMSRLHLSGSVCVIGPDELRFRSWEVDRLFRELYGRPLLPDEVAELERKTGGWVAALHLFHLATTAYTSAERRSAIAHVGRRSGPDWDFLADNVVSGLPDDLKLFLLETSPLVQLSAAVCDELLGQHQSEHALAELEQRQLITPSIDTPGGFRAHEVLRAHLDGVLMEWEGADAVHKRYLRAAEVLEKHGRFAEALGAYCRAGDPAGAARLLGSRGQEVADRPGSWLVALPPSMIDDDPWLLLAKARQHRANGRFADAIGTYQQVERRALTASPAATARSERLVLAALLARANLPSGGWVGALRDAVVSDPIAAIADHDGDGPNDLLAHGLAELLAGEARRAQDTLRRAGAHRSASSTVVVVALMGRLIAERLASAARPAEADDLERAVTALDIPLLARLSRATTGFVSGSVELAEQAAEECRHEGDHVGAAVAWSLAAITAAWTSAPPSSPSSSSMSSRSDRAVESCRALGLETLVMWGLIATALADGAQGSAAAADVATRRAPAALQSLARLTVALAADAPDVGRRAHALAADHGLRVPTELIAARGTHGVSTGAPTAALHVRCFGRFELIRDGAPVDLDGLRPRARAVLRMLASHAATGVHRHVLGSELWPNDDEVSAAKKLQVAISSIRKAIAGDHGTAIVVRSGDVYMIDVGHHVTCDVVELVAAATAARTHLAGGDDDAAELELRHALALHSGELLPEDGAAEWVVARRRELRTVATDAARSLATLLLDRERASEAVDACRAGLAIDRYDDPLWRLLLVALERDGDPAGHAMARTEYDAVLADLGIDRRGTVRTG